MSRDTLGYPVPKHDDAGQAIVGRRDGVQRRAAIDQPAGLVDATFQQLALCALTVGPSRGFHGRAPNACRSSPNLRRVARGRKSLGTSVGQSAQLRNRDGNMGFRDILTSAQMSFAHHVTADARPLRLERRGVVTP